MFYTRCDVLLFSNDGPWKIDYEFRFDEAEAAPGTIHFSIFKEKTAGGNIEEIVKGIFRVDNPECFFYKLPERDRDRSFEIFGNFEFKDKDGNWGTRKMEEIVIDMRFTEGEKCEKAVKEYVSQGRMLTLEAMKELAEPLINAKVATIAAAAAAAGD